MMKMNKKQNFQMMGVKSLILMDNQLINSKIFHNLKLSLKIVQRIRMMMVMLELKKRIIIIGVMKECKFNRVSKNLNNNNIYNSNNNNNNNKVQSLEVVMKNRSKMMVRKLLELVLKTIKLIMRKVPPGICLEVTLKELIHSQKILNKQ